MAEAKRATVYFEPSVHRALRLLAAATDRSVSDLVNAAVRAQLVEDADDLMVLKARKGEGTVAFEDVVKSLKRRGRL